MNLRHVAGAAAVAALAAVGVAGPATAATTYAPWADSAHSHPLHWVLGDEINLNSPYDLGLRDFSGNVLPQPEVIDIDGEYNTAADVAALHGKGYKVICYFDAGVYENYRSDASMFPSSVIGNPDGNWAGSYWLDIRQQSTLLPIMQHRMTDWCANKGFDMIEPDEIDSWENNSGFPLTYADQVSYNRAIANMAHNTLRADGTPMSILQKGDIIQIQDLEPWFDATLNEECYRYNECTNPWNPDTGLNQVGLQAYSNDNKTVWVAEYTATAATRMCSGYKQQPAAPTAHWNGARYKLGLPEGTTAVRQPCTPSW